MRKRIPSTVRPRLIMTKRSKKMATTSKMKKRVVKREMTTKRAMMRKMMMKRVIVTAMKMRTTKNLLKTVGKSTILRKSTIFWTSQRRLKQMRSQKKQRERIRK